jgi:hypothetical protein
MTEPNFEPHLEMGSNTDATAWIESSTLPDEQKSDLRRFVAAFPTLTFARHTDALLDQLEQKDQVHLPRWLRDTVSTLAFVFPPLRFQVDDYQYLCPRSDYVDEVWYEFDFGYAHDQERQLFLDQGGVYPIGSWYGTDESYLAVDMTDPNDQRIFEFASEDLLDNSLDGKEVRASVYPIFDSYAQLLAHVTVGRLPDGSLVEARE